MSTSEKIYEPPRMKIYRFDDNDQILTVSGGVTTDLPDDYATRALNEVMGGTNTTIEK